MTSTALRQAGVSSRECSAIRASRYSIDGLIDPARRRAAVAA